MLESWRLLTVPVYDVLPVTRLCLHMALLCLVEWGNFCKCCKAYVTTFSCGLRVLCLLKVVALIKACWKHEPEERPSMADVTEIMHDIVSRVKRRVKAELLSRPGHVVPHA